MIRFLLVSGLLSCIVCASSYAKHPNIIKGAASYYGWDFHGKTMANGKKFKALGQSAANRTLPLGTKVLITNKLNGRKVHATIDDRGPYVNGRVIDVSLGLARRLHMVKHGVVPVDIKPLTKRPRNHRVRFG